MTPTEAELFWKNLHDACMTHYTGPNRKTKFESIKAAVRNAVQITKTQTVQSPAGLATTGIGLAKGPAAGKLTAVAVTAGVTAVALPFAAAVPVAVPIGAAVAGLAAVIGVGIGMAKAGAVDKRIGPEGSKDDNAAAMSVQLLDGRAKDLVAELSLLKANLERLSRVCYDSCAHWQDQVNDLGEARYLTNRVSQHAMYLQGLGQKLQSIALASSIDLDKVHDTMKQTTIERFSPRTGQQSPEMWHNHFCAGKKCLYPF